MKKIFLILIAVILLSSCATYQVPLSYYPIYCPNYPYIIDNSNRFYGNYYFNYCGGCEPMYYKMYCW